MSSALISAPSGLTNSKLALADADTSDVLSGKTFYSQNKELKTGNMPNNGAVNLSVDAGESVTIPIGYHNGSGIVTGSTELFTNLIIAACYYQWTMSGFEVPYTPNTNYITNVYTHNGYDDPVKITFGRTMEVRIVGGARTTSGGWTQIKCGDTVIAKTSLNTTKNFDTVVEVSEGTILAITTSYHEQQGWGFKILTT